MASVIAPPLANVATTPTTLPFDQRSVKFRPLAEAEAIEISVGMVKNILAVRSRSGGEPTASDIMKFMMLCKCRQLNPFTGDAYLLGYDAQDGTTSWSLITAIQALRKRAEANPQFDGCRHGIIILLSDGLPIEREGAMLLDGEKLVGGWAEIHRKDRKLPTRAIVRFSVYDTGRSRWKKDPGGMISKVAEAAGLREAFPSDLAGLYLREEFGADQMASPAPQQGIAALKAKLAAHDVPPPTHARREDELDESDQRESDHDEANQGDSPDDGVQADPGNPSSMTPEEMADLDRERQSNGQLFDSSPEYR